MAVSFHWTRTASLAACCRRKEIATDIEYAQKDKGGKILVEPQLDVLSSDPIWVKEGV